MDDNVIELKRDIDSKGIAFAVRGCSVVITPPEDRELTINELASVFDEGKQMAIHMHSLDLTNIPVEAMELHPDFGDPERLLNMRNWLQAAVVTRGASVTGAGMGMGEADLDVELEGFGYHVSIKPILK